MKYVKIYGLQRSGTNYLKAILEKNFYCRVLQNIGGWKHGFVNPNFQSAGFKTDLPKTELAAIQAAFKAGEVPLVSVYMNPFAWVYFFREYERDTNKAKPTPIKNLMAAYNSKNSHWREKCDVCVAYDSIVGAGANKALADIGNALGLRQLNDAVDASIEGEMARGGDFSYEKNIIKSRKFDKGFYLDAGYMDFLGEDEIDMIVELATFDFKT
jgi:hypothetical protein